MILRAATYGTVRRLFFVRLQSIFSATQFKPCYNCLLPEMKYLLLAFLCASAVNARRSPSISSPTIPAYRQRPNPFGVTHNDFHTSSTSSFENVYEQEDSSEVQMVSVCDRAFVIT